MEINHNAHEIAIMMDEICNSVVKGTISDRQAIDEMKEAYANLAFQYVDEDFEDAN